MLGARYAIIGSAVGVSEANGIGAPKLPTLEARLTASPGPGRFIPTHRGQELPASEIASLPTHSDSMMDPTYIALRPDSFMDFDYNQLLGQLHRCAWNSLCESCLKFLWERVGSEKSISSFLSVRRFSQSGRSTGKCSR